MGKAHDIADGKVRNATQYVDKRKTIDYRNRNNS